MRRIIPNYIQRYSTVKLVVSFSSWRGEDHLAAIEKGLQNKKWKVSKLQKYLKKGQQRKSPDKYKVIYINPIIFNHEEKHSFEKNN